MRHALQLVQPEHAPRSLGETFDRARERRVALTLDHRVNRVGTGVDHLAIRARGVRGAPMRLARLAPDVLHADLRACNAYAGGVEAAAKLKCPVQFILGARDMMTPPRGAEELIGKIENSSVARIAISGHSLMAEAPDETLNALIAFL